MSSPLSLGDLFTLGQTAWTLYQACSDAGPQFSELGTLCSSISLAIRRCRPNEPSAFVRRTTVKKEDYQAIELLANRIEDSLQSVKQILGKYEGIDVPSLRNVRRRLIFGLFTVSDCNALKRTMIEQVHTLTLLLQGVSIDFQGQSVALLSELVIDKRMSKSGSAVNVDDIDDKTWEELVKDLKLRNSDVESTLLTRARDIRGTVVAKIKELMSKPTTSSVVFEETNRIVDAAAETSLEPYGPWLIDWFYPRLFPRYFGLVTVYEAFADASLVGHPSYQPHNIEREYSAEDRWLCPFLEGWALNRTQAKRMGALEEAFYFSFNNLACGTNRPPRTSRLYFWRAPLVPSDQFVPPFNGPRLLNLWETTGMTPQNTYAWTRFNGVEARPAPMNNIVPPSIVNQQEINVPCIGFKFKGRFDSTWNPWPGHLDLSDPVTAQFVLAHYGNDGLPFHHSDETIDQSMPKDWVWKKDVSGQGRHIYTYLGAKDGVMHTTVHPSRFFRDDDTVPVQLPPGWNRRLDRDGNLFFVDDNTHTASRLDPRFNRNIDPVNGLPHGWSSVLVKDDTVQISPDNKDQVMTYYYTRIGKTLVGTKWPSAILTKSLDLKDFLVEEPKAKEPRKIDESNHRVSYLGTLNVPEPPPIKLHERQRYYDIFREVARQGDNQLGKYRITRDQAEARCRNSGLPSAVYIPILLRADANRDSVFTPPEFAKMLHFMQFALKDWQKDQSLPPPTQHQLTEYDQAFEKYKEPENLVISENEALEAAREAYPKSLLDFAGQMWKTKIEKTAGENMLDVVQFGEGMHELYVEMVRRKALAMVGGDPVDDETPETGARETSQDVVQLALYQVNTSQAPMLSVSGAVTPGTGNEVVPNMEAALAGSD